MKLPKNLGEKLKGKKLEKKIFGPNIHEAKSGVKIFFLYRGGRGVPGGGGKGPQKKVALNELKHFVFGIFEIL